MISIVFTPEIQKRIHEIVYACEGETGVTLFGKREVAVFSVTDACGPDPLATRGACHYCGDDYASFVYEDLLKSSSALELLGTLHTHPHRMRRLSKEDCETINEVLKTSDELIAGVMFEIWRRDRSLPGLFFTEDSRRKGNAGPLCTSQS